MSNMSQRLGHFPEPWRPEVGGQITGRILAIDERTSEFGTYPLITIETDSGEELCWHAFHTVAKNELAKLRPVVGDLIGVAYHGKDPKKGYERYRVIVEPANPAAVKTPNWDAMAREAADDQTGVDLFANFDTHQSGVA